MLSIKAPFLNSCILLLIKPSTPESFDWDSVVNQHLHVHVFEFKQFFDKQLFENCYLQGNCSVNLKLVIQSLQEIYPHKLSEFATKQRPKT